MAADRHEWKKTAAEFISCQLDYCNLLLYGLPDTLLHKLQSVQNATARLITGTRHSDHSDQSLSGQVPLYLADDCRLVSDSTRRSLRSADISTCVLPRTLSSWRQNFCSRRTSPAELSSSPAAYSRHHLRTVPTTVEGRPFPGSMNMALCDF